MTNPNHPQTRQEMIDYMVTERTATDGQWAVIKYGGAAVLGLALTLGAIDMARDNDDSKEMSCPTAVNTNEVPECK